MTKKQKKLKALTKKVKGKLIAVASGEQQDRVGEVVKSDGWVLKPYKQNPVLQPAHNYSTPPIGYAKNLKIKDNQLLFEPVFHEITQTAREYKAMYESDPPIMRAFSVGFIPLERKEEDPSVITKQELLEISAVSVPASREALLTEKSYKDNNKKKEVQKWLKKNADTAITKKKSSKKTNTTSDIKGAIPYSVHGDGPKADRDAEWDAGKEVKKATGDAEKLMKMHAWVKKDAEDFDANERKWYKLPHHRGSGNQSVVWKGVAAAMAALFGARGGVELPSGDRKSVYNHLAKHYKQFDENPPEFKEYSKEELKELFPNDYVEKSPACRKKNETQKKCRDRKIPEIIDEGYDKDQAVAMAYSMCKQKCSEKDVKLDKSINETMVEEIERLAAKSKELRKENQELKEGRVLSGKNREVVHRAATALQDAASVLKDLLQATEPSKDQKSKKTSTKRSSEKVRKPRAAKQEEPADVVDVNQLSLRAFEKLNKKINRLIKENQVNRQRGNK